MSKRRPNLVIVNPDQMRRDFMTPAGHPFIATESLARLASEGSFFADAYCACPMCGPSRSSFVTGLYPPWHGVLNYHGTLELSRPNALRQLRDAGYRLAIYGKDHIFRSNPVGPVYHEGDEFCVGNLDDHPGYLRAWDTATIEKGSKWDTTGRIAQGALSFLERAAGSKEPFFLTLNFQDPHPMFACPEPYASMFDPEQFSLPPNFRREPAPGEPRRLSVWREHSRSREASELDFKKAMAFYCGQIRYVDEQLGRVLDALERLKLADDTVVLFWSDHGEYLGDFGVTHKQSAFYDCLVGVPAILKDPAGRIPAGRIDGLVEAMDLMAGALDLCGVAQPEGSLAKSVASPSWKPRPDVLACGGLRLQGPEKRIEGLALKAPHAPSQYGPGAMLRTDEWKLVAYADGDEELYNMKDDPFETKSLAADARFSSVKEALRLRLLRRLLCDGAEPESLPSFQLSLDRITRNNAQ